MYKFVTGNTFYVDDIASRFRFELEPKSVCYKGCMPRRIHPAADQRSHDCADGAVNVTVYQVTR